MSSISPSPVPGELNELPEDEGHDSNDGFKKHGFPESHALLSSNHPKPKTCCLSSGRLPEGSAPLASAGWASGSSLKPSIPSRWFTTFAGGPQSRAVTYRG